MSVPFKLIGCLIRRQMNALLPGLVKRPSIEQIQAALTAPGQAYEIEQLIIDGNPVKCWKNMVTTLPGFVQASREFGDADYIVYQDERLTYTEHYRQVARLAHALIDQFGIKKGDRVAVAMRNYPEWSIAFWAAASVGAIVVPMNAWWTSRELAYGLTDSGTRLVFADEQRLGRIRDIESELPVEHFVVARCDNIPEGVHDFAALVEGGPEDIELPKVAIDPEDDATLFYTSGTTGFPKGTLGTHRNFCSAAPNVRFSVIQSMLRGGTPLRNIISMVKTQQAIPLAVPLFHVTGCQAQMLTLFSSGGKMVIMYKWDPEVAVDLIEKEKVTGLIGVPAMTRQLVDLPGIEKRDLSSLINVGSGGAPVPPDLFHSLTELMPQAGTSNGYGITETSSGICSIAGPDYAERPDSVGIAPPAIELKLVDDKGNEVPQGEQGEIWIRGPNVVKGYWNKPEATAEAFTKGWFHTGDVGRFDEDGFLYICDRLKDMIIRGGENIYSAEVEAALTEHPAVSIACVFGIPDEVMGEEVGAVVQVTSAEDICEETLQQFVGGHLAAFKVPSRIWLHEEPLPLGATGKVQKKELREHYIAQVAAQQAG